MNIKKVITTAAAVIMLANAFPIHGEAGMSQKAYQVYVDGTYINFSNNPIEKQGRTLVEFRPLFEALGMKVNWDSKTRTVLAEGEETSIRLTINSIKAQVNGVEKKLEVAPRELKGRTLVPLRFVGETSGTDVEWNGATKVINITTSPELQVVSFPDPVFEKAIRSYINKPTGEILRKDVEGITAIKDTFYLLGGETWIHKDPEPITSLEGIQYLTNLEELDLPYHNRISDISMLKDLNKLRVLNLGWDDEVISDITPLGNLTNLEELNLAVHNIKDIGPLKNLINLRRLILPGNNISDYSPLSNLTKLEHLNLSNTGVKDLSLLGNLTELKELYISDNKVVDVSPLKNLTNLRKLILDSNQIEDIDALAGLNKLEGLFLSDNRIVQIPDLNNLTQLKEFYINDNNIREITGELNGLSSLETLNMSNNQISKIDDLAGLDSIKSIDLGNNRLTKAGGEFSNLPQLEELILDHNQIASLDDFTGLEKLKGLNLSYNQIGMIGSALNNLSNLEHLNLNYNHLKAIEDLSQLVNLKFLDLEGNAVLADDATVTNLDKLKNLGVIVSVELAESLPDLVLYPNLTTVFTNGKYAELPEAPYVKNFRTLVPLRFIGESLGAEVNYYDRTQKIVLEYESKRIELVVGSTKVIANGKTQIIDAAPEVKNDTTFVPLRFVSEQLGAKVRYNGRNQQITITKQN
ncbi:MAG: stalk domain-containing protein [Bacillota bacterium]|jgi:Leucine-rich repeat (LRR) protein